LKVGDEITWVNDGKKVATEVVEITNHKSFANMIKYNKLKNVLPGIRRINDGVAIYKKFYTDEDEQTYGVIGIHVDLL